MNGPANDNHDTLEKEMTTVILNPTVNHEAAVRTTIDSSLEGLRASTAALEQMAALFDFAAEPPRVFTAQFPTEIGEDDIQPGFRVQWLWMLENVDLADAVENAIAGFSSEQWRDKLDLDSAVERHLEEFDFAEAIGEGLEKYDFTDAIREEVDRELNLCDTLQNKIDEAVQDAKEDLSSELEDLVEQTVDKRLLDKLRGALLEMVDENPDFSRRLVRSLGVALQNATLPRPEDAVAAEMSKRDAERMTDELRRQRDAARERVAVLEQRLAIIESAARGDGAAGPRV